MRQVVTGIEAQMLEIERTRNQHHTVQIHAVTLEQMPGKPRSTGRAVRLADQILRTGPAPVAGAVQPDKLAHRLYIALVLVVFLDLLSLDHAAVTGANRVDEYQIGSIEQGKLVGYKPAGLGRDA